jgi:hypothetical protein
MNYSRNHFRSFGTSSGWLLSLTSLLTSWLFVMGACACMGGDGRESFPLSGTPSLLLTLSSRLLGSHVEAVHRLDLGPPPRCVNPTTDRSGPTESHLPWLKTFDKQKPRPPCEPCLFSSFIETCQVSFGTSLCSQTTSQHLRVCCCQISMPRQNSSTLATQHRARRDEIAPWIALRAPSSLPSNANRAGDPGPKHRCPFTMGTKKPEERQRTVHACDNCKRRKQKVLTTQCPY